MKKLKLILTTLCVTLPLSWCGLQPAYAEQGKPHPVDALPPEALKEQAKDFYECLTQGLIIRTSPFNGREYIIQCRTTAIPPVVSGRKLGEV